MSDTTSNPFAASPQFYTVAHHTQTSPASKTINITPITAECTIKKSRFIAHLFYAANTQEAKAFITQLKDQHKQARHVVYAWRIAPGEERLSDDGEPSKTAGAPTAAVLAKYQLIQAGIATVRYFGGTLLGTGGLTRAYEEAAELAVQNAQASHRLVPLKPCALIEATLTYAQYDQALYLVRKVGAKIQNTQYANNITLTLLFIEGTQAEFMATYQKAAQVKPTQLYPWDENIS